MATTAQEVFDIAVGLMDEINEATGKTDTSDTKEYKQRTLLILTALRGECYPYSDTYRKPEDNKRPVCPPVTDFLTPLGLDDVISQSILPYGLAGHLLLEENPSAASFFLSRYGELLVQLAAKSPAEPEPIEDIYGGVGHRKYGMWF